MDFNKVKESKPMKYVGGTAGKSRVTQFLANPNTFSDWIYTDKVDGEWSRIVYDLDGEVTIQGRGVSRVTGKQKDNTELLPHLVEDVKTNLPKGSVIIGELSFDNHINFVQREIGSILRCKAPKAIERQLENKLVFYAFDCLAMDGVDLSTSSYEKRTGALKDVSGDYIKPVKQYKVDETAIAHLDKVLADGGEGIMIMNKDGKYLPGSRSVRVSLKIKKELGELTLPVTAVLEPKVKYEGSESDTWQYELGGQQVTKYHFNGWKAGVEVDYNGNTVGVTSGITDEDAKWLSTPEAQEKIKNGELMAEVTAMEEIQANGSDKPSLRHPVLLKLRTDL